MTHIDNCQCIICSGQSSIGDFLGHATKIVEKGEIGTIGITAPPWMVYTYGRHHQGLPELVIMGLPSRQGESVIHAATHVETPGRYEDVLKGFPVIVVPALSQKLVIARYLGGDDLKALQILWPDKEGRWPWDPEYQGSPQPLLGELESAKF